MPYLEVFGDWEKARKTFGNSFPMRLKAAVRQASTTAAIFLVREIVKGIRSQAPGGKAFAPLAQVTIDAKHSSKALIDTGLLINSITYRIMGDAAMVGVLRSRGRGGDDLVDIAAVMEYGATIRQPNGATIIIPARPFLHPVMEQYREKIIDAYRTAIKHVLGI